MLLQKLLSRSLFAILLLSVNCIFAQNQLSNAGKDFWLSFARNNQVRNSSLRIYITSEVNTQATITTVFGSTTYNITADSTTEVILNADTFSAILQTNNPAVENKGINVTSRDDITVFASNVQNFTTDASVVLPTAAIGIGPEYVFNIGTIQQQSGLLFVGIEDSTVIRFFNQPNNFPDSIILNQHQVFMIPYNSNSTTMRATTPNDCKPFAVFFTNTCANVGGCVACDHLYTQVLPNSKWSTSYVATPFINQTNGYLCSVLALEDSTWVSVNGASPFMLQKEERRTVDINSQIIACFDANRPISVQQLMKGVGCHGSGSLGDPAVVELNASTQKIPRATFVSLTGGVISTHYVNVVVEVNHKHLLYIDSIPADTTKWLDSLGCGRYAVYRDVISAGSHTIINDSGFIAYAYGFTRAESYLYSIGASYENQIYNFNFVADKRCPGEPIQVVRTGDELRSSYFLQGNRVDSGSTATYVFNAPGIYEVKMVANTFDAECADTIIKSIEIGGAPKVFPNDTTICNPFEIVVRIDTSLVDSFKWDIPDYTADTLLIDTRGKYKVLLLDTFGCSYTDSVFIFLYRDPIAGLVVPDYTCFESPATFINRSVDTSQITDLSYFIIAPDSSVTFFSDSILQWVLPDTGLFEGVFVASNGGVCNDTLTFDTYVHPLPNAAFSVNEPEQCLRGNQFVFTDSSTHAYNLSQFIWDFPALNRSDSSSQTALSLTTADTLSFTLRVSDSLGCVGVDTGLVTAFPQAQSQIIASDTQACLLSQNFDFQTAITVSSGTITGVVWSWNNRTDTVQSLQNIVFDSLGPNTVQLIANTDLNCPDTTAITVTILGHPEAQINLDSSEECLASNVFYFSDVSSHNRSISSQIWRIPATEARIQGESQIELTFPQADTFDVWLRVADAQGCDDSTMTSVVVHPQTDITFFSSDTACFKDTVWLEIGTQIDRGSVVQIDWDLGDSATGQGNQVSHVYSQTGAYTISVVTTSDQNCMDTFVYAQTAVIRPLPSPVIQSLGPVCDTEEVTFVNLTADTGQHAGSQYVLNWYGTPLPVWDSISTWTPQDTGFQQAVFSATDPLGCRDSVEVSFRVIPTPVADFFFPFTEQCLRGNRFAAEDRSDAKGYNLTYFWDLNAGITSQLPEPIFSYPLNGVYPVFLRVQNEFGCTDIKRDTFNIDFFPVPQPDFVALEDSLCLRGNQFVFNNQTQLSSGTFESFLALQGYDTLSMEDTLAYSFSQPGLVRVDLFINTDFQCKDTLTKWVRVWEMPEASALTRASTGCQGQTSFTFVNTSDRPAEWQFTWFYDGIQNTTEVDSVRYVFTDEGLYSVDLEVQNQFDCRDTAQLEIIVNPVPRIEAVPSSMEQCFAYHFFDLTSQTSLTQGNYANIWEVESLGTFSSDSIMGLRFLSVGPKEVRYKAVSDSLCADSLSFTLVVHPDPIADFGVLDPDLCFRGHVFEVQNRASLSGGTLDSIIWVGPNIQRITLADSLQFQFADTGIQWITQRVVSDQGCADTTTRFVRLFLNPIASFTTFMLDSCFDQNLLQVTNTSQVWNGVGRPEYFLSDSTVFSNVDFFEHVFQRIDTFAVVLNITDDQGCSDTFESSVIVRPQPFAHIEVDTLSECFNTNQYVFKDLSLSRGVQYDRTWEVLNTAVGSSDSLFVHSFAADGLQTVALLVEGPFGCSGRDTFETEVLFQNNLDITVSDTSYCLNEQAFSFSYAGSTDASLLRTLQWVFPDSVWVSQTSGTKRFSDTGSYPSFLITENQVGCRDTLRFEWVVRPLPQVQFQVNDSLWCFNNQALQLQSVAAFDPGTVVSYFWDMGDGTTETGALIENKQYSNPGTFSVLHYAVASNGCRDSSMGAVHVFSNPIANFAADTLRLCERNHVFNLSATSTLFAPVQEHEWQFNTAGIEDSGEQIQVRFNEYGNYPFAMISTDTLGCADTTSGLLVVYPQAQLAFLADTVCLGEESRFTDLSSVDSGSIAQYDWLLGDGSAHTGPSVVHAFDQPGTYSTLLITQTDAGCLDSLFRDAIAKVRTLPIADFLFEKELDSLQFTGYQFNSQSTGNTVLQHEWTMDRFGTVDGPQPYWMFPDTGSMQVQLRVQDTFGCEQTVVKSFVTYPETEPFVPNAFSPNSDRINELFMPLGVVYAKSYSMEIYNRWGELLYTTNDISQGWDGTYKGTGAPQGVYVYKIRYLTLQGQFVNLSGSVTLMR